MDVKKEVYYISSSLTQTTGSAAARLRFFLYKMTNKILPIVVGTGAVLLLFLGTFLIARNAYAAPFPVATGGTGSTTLTGILIGNGTSAVNSLTVGSGCTLVGTTLSCAGTGGSTYPFPNQLGGGNATSSLTGFSGGLISTASSTAQFLTMILSTTTSATTTNFAITGAPAVNCNGTNALTTSASGNVTCTAQAQGTVTAVSVATANGFAGNSSGGATPALTLSTTVTGLTLGNGTSLAAYAGTSCTNAILSLNGSGVATCGGSAYPFTYATTYNTLSAASTTPFWFQGNGTYGLFASSTSIIDYATSTAHSVSGALYIPNAANPALGATAGRLAIDTTAASTSLHWQDASGEHAVFASTSPAFSYATSSPVGTTTILIPGPTRKVIYDQMGCTSIGGTATVALGNGTATSTYQISGTSLTTTYVTLVANNTFTQGVSRLIAIGNWSSTAISQVSCTFSQAYDPN